MKYFIFLMPSLILFFMGSVNAQNGSKRFILAEDFSSASCPPSVDANIKFNLLCDSNRSKMIKLTYQWKYGKDSLYMQNISQLSIRSNYYGITYVPNALMNGGTSNLKGRYFIGSPYNWTQDKVDSAANVPASFDIGLVYWFNLQVDSIFIEAVILCTKSDTFSDLKFRCALTEDKIHFEYLLRPGTNSETNFFNVSRDMYPDALGTTLKSIWSVGEKRTISFARKIPNYIYNKNQLAVVGFIQDDFNKAVNQAAYSASYAALTLKPNEVFMNYSIFPNPTNGEVFISIERDASLKIYTINGSNILEFQIFSGMNNIDLIDLSTGIYFYEIIFPNNIIKTGKLILK